MASFKLEPERAARIIEATTCTIFNEHDSAQRRKIMEQYWAQDIVCFSPFGAASGFDEIDQLWAGLHAGNQQSWIFQKTESIWISFNLAMQRWTFGEPGAADPGMKGYDVVHVNADGKVEKLYALIEGVSNA